MACKTQPRLPIKGFATSSTPEGGLHIPDAGKVINRFGHCPDVSVNTECNLKTYLLYNRTYPFVMNVKSNSICSTNGQVCDSFV